jgi:CelD/BcsL family acetyltransferase involved in cellulose biosynthesis
MATELRARGGTLARLDVDDPRWQDLVDANPAVALPFHAPPWVHLVAECYGFPVFVAGVGSDERLDAAVPVAEVRSLTRQRSWVALPFTDSLPILGGDAAVETLALELDAARTAAGVATAEFRSALGTEGDRTVGFGHVLTLAADALEVRRGFDRKRVEQVIRAVERRMNDGELRIAEVTTEAEFLGTYFPLHVLTRRRLGVPAQPKRFFRLLWQRILSSDGGFALLAHAGGTVVAGAVFVEDEHTTVYKFGASDYRARQLNPNHAILWTAIQRSCARGRRAFDFGRTDLGNAGLRAFKRGWGTEEDQLCYSYLGRERAPAGDGRATRALAAVLHRSPALATRVSGELFYRYAA